jgi:hypothetical protein
MRRKELNKIKNKKLKKEYSEFELEELIEEIKEYKTLMLNIGMDKELIEITIDKQEEEVNNSQENVK